MVRSSVSIWRVAVTGHDDVSTQRLGPYNGGVDVVYLEPKKQAIPRRQVVRITDASVVMLLFPAVQLQDQLAGVDEPFVVRPTVGALAIEQPLIPSAAGLDISNANQRLRSHHVASPYPAFGVSPGSKRLEEGGDPQVFLDPLLGLRDSQDRLDGWSAVAEELHGSISFALSVAVGRTPPQYPPKGVQRGLIASGVVAIFSDCGLVGAFWALAGLMYRSRPHRQVSS